ncbi:MAG: phospholipase D family protein, partial [Dokdonella sp.]
ADCPALAAAIEEFFAHATTPQNAFHVVLEPASAALSSRTMRWIGSEDGKPVEYDHDPGVSAWKRIEVDLLRMLPIEGLL